MVGGHIDFPLSSELPGTPSGGVPGKVRQQPTVKSSNHLGRRGGERGGGGGGKVYFWGFGFRPPLAWPRRASPAPPGRAAWA